MNALAFVKQLSSIVEEFSVYTGDVICWKHSDTMAYRISLEDLESVIVPESYDDWFSTNSDIYVGSASNIREDGVDFYFGDYEIDIYFDNMIIIEIIVSLFKMNLPVIAMKLWDISIYQYSSVPTLCIINIIYHIVQYGNVDSMEMLLNMDFVKLYDEFEKHAQYDHDTTLMEICHYRIEKCDINSLIDLCDEFNYIDKKAVLLRYMNSHFDNKEDIGL